MLGAAYAAVWVVAPDLVQLHTMPNGFADVNLSFWLFQAFQQVFLVAVFGGMFMVLRIWWSLARSPGSDSQTQSKAQFSILNVLLLTAAAAVVMALIRVSRAPSGIGTDSGMVAATVLGFGIFFFNTACAAFAALSPSPVKRNCVLVLCISALLGVAISLATGQDRAAWWLIGGGVLISVITTAVVIASLLVVRSAGYRLIRRTQLFAA
jgi:hypothetical protein